MTLQFETTFLKAMQLLHSPDQGATDQLKTMLDECLAQKKAPPIMPIQKPSMPTIKPVIANRQHQQQHQQLQQQQQHQHQQQPVSVHNAIIVPSDDIDPSGLSCQVCKKSDQKAGNEIVECQECHNLYHQECHKPSLANENVKDPRFVWYCSTCTSKRKKVKLPPNKPTVAASNNSSSKDTKETQNPEVSPFKSWSFLKK